MTSSDILYRKNYLIPESRASVLIIHGLHEHCERYSAMAEKLNEAGIDVYTFDLRGHGQSKGDRFFVQSIDEYVEDVSTILSQMPMTKPVFLLGHSMGGLVAVHFLLKRGQNSFHGLILSGAGLKPGKDITPFKAKLVRFIARFLPKMNTVPVKPPLVSRDKVEVQKYIDDPLIALHGAKAGLGVALLDAIEELNDRRTNITIPALIMHGAEDQITDPEGSKKFFQEISSTDKTLKIWDGCYHEIFNELNRDEIIAYTADWINQKL
jgi:acylglycerol lipase